MSKGEIWNWQMHPGKEAAAKKSGQRIQIWGPGTFWCVLAWMDFWKHIYLGSRFIQNGLFLARPDPMNHVWGADLSESPNIPPVVAKAPSQCGRSFKTRRQKLSKHKILLVASNGQKCIFQIHKAILIPENICSTNRSQHYCSSAIVLIIEWNEQKQWIFDHFDTDRTLENLANVKNLFKVLRSHYEANVGSRPLPGRPE